MASGDVIAVMDAVLQHPPKLLPEMFKEIGKHEIVIASRYISGGKIKG